MKTIAIILGLMACIGFIWADVPYQTVTVASVTLNYRVTPDMQNLDCQLIGTTTGWVGVGFIPVQGMQSANFVIGYDTGGTIHIRDDWGTAPNSHASDTSLGGTNNISNASSSETAGVTQLNFTIPLNSGDNFDRVLAIGQTYNIILGRGQDSADNFTGPHLEVGPAQITIVQPVSNEDNFITRPLISALAYPNPFSFSTGISFNLKHNSSVMVKIYNTKGQLIRLYPETVFAKGLNQIIWDGKDSQNRILPSGQYLCSISANGQLRTIKLVLRK